MLQLFLLTHHSSHAGGQRSVSYKIEINVHFVEFTGEV